MSAVPLRGDEVPASTSQFLGRDAEVTKLEAMLVGPYRFVTLVGPGGIGKTRLAAETLRRMSQRGFGVVHWVRLARLPRESQSVVEEIAHSVVRFEVVGQATWEALIGALVHEVASAQGTILVLDNCEHVITAVAPLVTALLEAVPGLTILATSRESIGGEEECIVTVPSLGSGEALDLMRLRAGIVGRPVSEDPEQIDIARTICRRVDNNPLFIRLAAARLRHRPPAKLLEELTGDTDDKRFTWRGAVRSGTEPRQDGIYGAIAWSFGLCAADEQLLLERLSIFAAGYEAEQDDSADTGIELEAIVSICADADLPAGSIDSLLDRLVDQSLVSAQITTESVRYFLLESVRLFARRRLADRPRELLDLEWRFRRYYRDKVGDLPEVWSGTEQQAWVDWVRSAWDNILVAIETSFADPAESLIGLQIATVLTARWIPRGRAGALLRLTERALAVTRSAGPVANPLRVRAMALIARLALWQGECSTARDLLDNCVATAGVDHPDWRATASIDIGLPASIEWTWGTELFLVDLDERAIAVLERAGRKFQEVEDQLCRQACEEFAIFARAALADAPAALETTRRYLEETAQNGSPRSIAFAEIAHTIALARMGDARGSLDLSKALLARSLMPDDMWAASWSIVGRFIAFTHLVTEGAAFTDSREAQKVTTELARLAGAFTDHHQSTGVAIHRIPLLSRNLYRALEITHQALGDTVFTTAKGQGRDIVRRFVEDKDLRWETLVSESTNTEEASDRTRLWEALTPAEREVAALAAVGWTNSAIAAHRGCSVRTVDAQLASIRQKLTVTSRHEIRRHAPSELLDAAAKVPPPRPGQQ